MVWIFRHLGCVYTSGVLYRVNFCCYQPQPPRVSSPALRPTYLIQYLGTSLNQFRFVWLAFAGTLNLLTNLIYHLLLTCRGLHKVHCNITLHYHRVRQLLFYYYYHYHLALNASIYRYIFIAFLVLYLQSFSPVRGASTRPAMHVSSILINKLPAAVACDSGVLKCSQCWPCRPRVMIIIDFETRDACRARMIGYSNTLHCFRFSWTFNLVHVVRWWAIIFQHIQLSKWTNTNALWIIKPWRAYKRWCQCTWKTEKRCFLKHPYVFFLMSLLSNIILERIEFSCIHFRWFVWYVFSFPNRNCIMSSHNWRLVGVAKNKTRRRFLYC